MQICTRGVKKFHENHYNNCIAPHRCLDLIFAFNSVHISKMNKVVRSRYNNSIYIMNAIYYTVSVNKERGPVERASGDATV